MTLISAYKRVNSSRFWEGVIPVKHFWWLKSWNRQYTTILSLFCYAMGIIRRSITRNYPKTVLWVSHSTIYVNFRCWYTHWAIISSKLNNRNSLSLLTVYHKFNYRKRIYNLISVKNLGDWWVRSSIELIALFCIATESITVYFERCTVRNKRYIEKDHYRPKCRNSK